MAKIITQTLDQMATRGLHDHLQDGFYRYCVDEVWTIPHFEKTLYDQAMLLWVYSLAYKLLAKPAYKTVVEKLIICLESTFENNNLYYSAHDADTEHQEGATYLWSSAELQSLLSESEYQRLSQEYLLTKSGNFAGKNHLLKKKLTFLPTIEKKLLTERKKRPQPFVDQKIVTSWNALAGIGLMMAYRFAGVKKARRKALALFGALLEKHYHGDKLAHTSLNATIQKEEFLEDYAAALILATLIYEETGKHKKAISSLYHKLLTFRDKDGWYQSHNQDFIKIPAPTYDHPTPSAVSLAELARF